MSDHEQYFRQGPAFTAAARVQEASLKPLKATGQILFNAKEAVRGSVLKDGVRSVSPKTVFMPVTATERRELLSGEYPIAVEPTAAEIAAFG
ncbi:hypothetical protein C8J24_2908 [Sphingomonas aerolata]|uniref:Uncharacterized protein n=1 Tax=Sphingomonas aerolata TaxID=185951 RepID=A0A2T4YMS2_9SPHN|nr:hypothetical protein [Sphingomonas aerolata]PTM44700.1 hypothetical protein C8J24_2908 [Sphingomonas aerolata]